MNVTVRNQICASDVDLRIILSQIFQNQTLSIRKFTGKQKSLNSYVQIKRIDKTFENSTDDSDSRNKYMSMALMSINAESPR